MPEILGMLRRSHYSGISKSRGYNFTIILHFKGLLGGLAHGVSSFPKYFCMLLCVPLYVCRLCINFQDLCARLLGMAALRILLLTFTSLFVIDFLSIRKVIITPHAQRERGKVIDGGVHISESTVVLSM